MNTGKVWLVGAGPSDVGLFTLKGKEALQNADVVVYDSLVGDSILSLIPPEARLIDAGKRAGNYTMVQDDTNRVLLEEALKGNKVVRLKGGDPFLFGRGGEELELLVENEIPFEIVSGVTSAIAVAAYAGIPVSHRDFCSSVHIITGHKKNADHPETDFESLVKLEGTLIFLMGVGSLNYICEHLMKAGMDGRMPAAVLEKGTTYAQRRVVSTLEKLSSDVAAAGIGTPAIIIVGKVCALADRFHWAEDRPLGGAKVIVTRPAELASNLSKKLRENGAEVLEIPSIKTSAIADNTPLKKAIAEIGGYQWVAFTSAAGVKIFFEALAEEDIDIRALFGIKLAAIGNGTAKALKQRGLKTDLIPAVNDAETLGAELAKMIAPNEKLLIPRAKIGSIELNKQLDAVGVRYDDIAVYDTLYIKNRFGRFDQILEDADKIYVAFTSASCVTGFVQSFGSRDYSSLTAVCIGKQTAAEAKKYGFKVKIADQISMDSMIEKMKELHIATKFQ